MAIFLMAARASSLSSLDGGLEGFLDRLSVLVADLERQERLQGRGHLVRRERFRGPGGGGRDQDRGGAGFRLGGCGSLGGGRLGGLGGGLGCAAAAAAGRLERSLSGGALASPGWVGSRPDLRLFRCLDRGKGFVPAAGWERPLDGGRARRRLG